MDIGVDEKGASKLFMRFDPDGSGQLDKNEFFAYAAKGSGDFRQLLRNGILDSDPEVDKVREVFQSWDKDGDGCIRREELEKVLVLLNPSFLKKDLNKLMKVIDKNGDGVIDYQEFPDWMEDTKKK